MRTGGSANQRVVSATSTTGADGTGVTAVTAVTTSRKFAARTGHAQHAGRAVAAGPGRPSVTAGTARAPLAVQREQLRVGATIAADPTVAAVTTVTAGTEVRARHTGRAGKADTASTASTADPTVTAADDAIGPTVTPVTAGTARRGSVGARNAGPAGTTSTTSTPQTRRPTVTAGRAGASRPGTTSTAVTDNPTADRTVTARTAIRAGHTSRPSRAVDEQRTPREHLNRRENPERLGKVDNVLQQVRPADLGGRIRAPARGQVLQERTVELPRLRTERLKLLAVAAEQLRNRGRHLILGRSGHRRRRGRGRRGGLLDR